MNSSPAIPTDRKTTSRVVVFIFTNIVSIICLVWVLHGANLGALRHEVEKLDWPWVIFAVVTDIGVYAWQGWRWSLVLRPVLFVSPWKAMRAIYVGLFANEVLPLRAGELIRCFLLGRWEKTPLSVMLASALIERIFDGIWLIACFWFTIRHVTHVPKLVTDGAIFLALLILVTGIFLAIAMFWKEQTLDSLLRARWLSWVHILIKDLHLIGHSRYLYFAFLVSLPYLLMQVLPIYGIMRAYGPLDDVSSLSIAFTAMVMLRFGSIVPQAPGNLGSFQALAVASLLLFHVHRAVAKRFSLILWAVITLPLLIVGFLALAVTGTSLAALHREATKKANGVHANIVAGTGR